MTKAELQRLVDECCQRFDAVRARFSQDAKRDPGDKSTKLIVCWWEALQDLVLVECMEVVRDIFTGKLPRPYPSDFPSTIAAEVRQRKSEQLSKGSSGWQLKMRLAEVEASKTRLADAELESKFGPMLDAMSPEQLRQLAASKLSEFMLSRFERNPRGLLVRLELLAAVATVGNQQEQNQEVML